MRKLRTHYAICLGTFPHDTAHYLKNMMSKSTSCTVEFVLRPRANNCYAIYPRLKRSLERATKLAAVRDKMLYYAGQRTERKIK